MNTKEMKVRLEQLYAAHDRQGVQACIDEITAYEYECVRQGIDSRKTTPLRRLRCSARYMVEVI